MEIKLVTKAEATKHGSIVFNAEKDQYEVVGVKSLSVEGNNIVVNKQDGTTEQVALPAPTVDVKLSGLTFDGTRLKATLSDGSEVETDFSSEVIKTAIEAATPEQKTAIVAALNDQLNTALRGDEIQDSAGNTLGYLFKV